jgi:hypothetical protein
MCFRARPAKQVSNRVVTPIVNQMNLGEGLDDCVEVGELFLEDTLGAMALDVHHDRSCEFTAILTASSVIMPKFNYIMPWSRAVLIEIRHFCLWRLTNKLKMDKEVDVLESLDLKHAKKMKQKREKEESLVASKNERLEFWEKLFFHVFDVWVRQPEHTVTHKLPHQAKFLKQADLPTLEQEVIASAKKVKTAFFPAGKRKVTMTFERNPEKESEFSITFTVD